jgi:hypothetical protein
MKNIFIKCIFILTFISFSIIGYSVDTTFPQPIKIPSSSNNNTSILNNNYPYLVEYYGQTIPIIVPFSAPIIIELPDVVSEKTVESQLSGLDVYPKGREETKIIKLLATTNIDKETFVHVKLVNGMVITLAVKILKVDSTTNLFQYNTRYKIIDKLHPADSSFSASTKSIKIDSPEIINDVVDRLSYNQLLSLTGISNDLPIKDVDYLLSEDKHRAIKIKSFTLSSASLIVKSAISGNDKIVPVTLFGLKTYFCNKDINNSWTLTIDYIKNIFPEYYKISYNRELDSLISPNSCVPVYIIIWENIKK